MLNSKGSGLKMIIDERENEDCKYADSDEVEDSETHTLTKALYHVLKGFGCFERI